MSMLGLPASIEACLFDLDGVLTDTAVLHSAAWKRTFDSFLERQALRCDTSWVPFDEATDYPRYVDGRSRLDGISTFMAARGIELPFEDSVNGDTVDSIQSLGKRKTEIFDQLVRERGVRAYPGSLRYLEALHDHRVPCAVVSASKHACEVVAAAGLTEFFDARIDGIEAEQHHFAGKPAPDAYLAAAKALGRTPDSCAVFEDALAGVAAGRAGGFGWVVGVDRVGHARELVANGADLVIADLAELL